MSKSSKHRPCPSLAKDLTRSECAESRHSRIPCLGSCPFNPFAIENYDGLLEQEDALDAYSLSWLFKTAPNGAMLRKQFETALAGATPQTGHCIATWNLFFLRDAQQKSWAQRLLEDTSSPLKNDNRVFLQGKSKVQVALIEVHRIIDHQQVEFIDLLEPGSPTRLMVDRSLAAQTTRFTTLLAWLYPLPHYSRLSGAAISMPDVDGLDAMEVLQECLLHFKAPLAGPARALWLAENFDKLADSLSATRKERQRQSLALLNKQALSVSDKQAIIPTKLLQNPTMVQVSFSRDSLPPELKTQAEITAYLRQEHLRKFADQALPALNGKTPREAASIPSLRAPLLRSVKLLVRLTDEANLHGGTSNDTNSLIRSLGLTEIDFPAPPSCAQAKDAASHVLPLEEAMALNDYSPPQATPFPLNECLSYQEVSKRMKRALTAFPSAAAAMEAMSLSGASIIEDLDTLTLDLLSEDEAVFMAGFFCPVWFCLVPPERPAPKLILARMQNELSHELLKIPEWTAGGPEQILESISKGCNQPFLLTYVFEKMFECLPTLPKKSRIKPEALIPMIATLKVVLNELDRSLQAR